MKALFSRRTLYGLGAGALMMLVAMCSTGHAKADPYCGPGNNYDPRHNICQPGNPVPAPGLFPYPLPNNSPGGPYGGN